MDIVHNIIFAKLLLVVVAIVMFIASIHGAR